MFGNSKYNAMRFKDFIKSEERRNIEETLKKLPRSHRELLRGYDWLFHPGNTLNGDDKHVGYLDKMNKEIAVAAPWHYGREFTILHEIAHEVYDRLPAQVKHQWTKLVAVTKDDQSQELSDEEKAGEKTTDQDPVEIFCMAYAQFYAKNKLKKFDNPEWEAFIKELPQ